MTSEGVWERWECGQAGRETGRRNLGGMVVIGCPGELNRWCKRMPRESRWWYPQVLCVAVFSEERERGVFHLVRPYDAAYLGV